MDLSDASLPADAVAASLQLLPHPEGGRYREVWRDAPVGGGRGAGTAILFLLAAGERSHWHRVDASEGWHWHAGEALRLELSRDGRELEALRLGPRLQRGEQPFAVVPKDCWQAAATLGSWTLVSCTVSPAFTFSGFELAPAGWRPGENEGSAPTRRLDA